MNLKRLEKKTLKFLKKNNYTEEDINKLIDDVNTIFARRSKDDGEDTSLVVHDAKYSGGFILFGGWTKIFDSVIPSGARGHELYLAFGGVGAGGWSGKCDIELIEDGTIEHNGITYIVPSYHYKNSKDDFENYSTGFDYFHDNVKSFMFMYLPQFIQNVPVFVYYDKHSNRLGVSVPSASIASGIGGGSVKVES